MSSAPQSQYRITLVQQLPAQRKAHIHPTSRVSINTAVTLSFGQKARVRALLHLICICPKVISLCPFHPVCFPLRKQTAVFVRNDCLHWTAEYFGAITLGRQCCCYELLSIAHYGDLPTFFFHFIWGPRKERHLCLCHNHSNMMLFSGSFKVTKSNFVEKGECLNNMDPTLSLCLAW